VFSTQHDESVIESRDGKKRMTDAARRVLIEELILPTLKDERPDLINGEIIYHINPTGIFLEGGPHGDTGLTGRKIIVDSYGGRGRHGGGAFSGKDPTKVDRSAAYMARYIAKNVVAAGLARQCEVQLSYAIGYPEPLSVWVTTNGTIAPGLTEERLVELIRKHFQLTPKGINESLDLRRPIYRETARHGHFGRERPEFTWEKTDRSAELRKAAGV
jgi:S-adenosylmethionine synthetase